MVLGDPKTEALEVLSLGESLYRKNTLFLRLILWSMRAPQLWRVSGLVKTAVNWAAPPVNFGPLGIGKAFK